jgi:DNA polymerase II small subunit
MEEIVQRFMEHGYQVHPEALEMIKHGDTGLIGDILESLDKSVLVVQPEHVRSVLQPKDVVVIEDVKVTHTSDEDFFHYFEDRYTRLGGIIRKRLNARSISSLKRDHKLGRFAKAESYVCRFGEAESDFASQNRPSSASQNRPIDFCIIGMVNGTRKTTGGNELVSVEDTTGSCSVLIPKGLNIIPIPDEVIGITGRMNNGLLIADSITYPGVPVSFHPRRSSVQASVILTSDMHVGSKMFLEDAWKEFTMWLNGEMGDKRQNAIAENVKYMVIAGDTVDGIGVYPNQQKQLEIVDIYEQYKRAGEFLAEIPDRIRIIIAPGNHDAVRGPEPQPKLPTEIRRFFGKNVTFVGNPSMIELNGVKILIYHGSALEDFFHTLSISYQKPDIGMREMLKRRHLAPVYGKHTPIVPEKSDRFVIETIPDILHCGHIHTFGVSRYHGVTLVNSGTWQEKTEYQRRLNITPVPGRIPIIDLQSMDVQVLRFH